MFKVLVFDTETNGLVKNSVIPLRDQPKLIEFYGNIIDNKTGEVLRELEFLCNPGSPLDDVITKVTGLTDDDLKDKPPFSQFEGDLRGLIGEADAIIAHNLSFDFAVLSAEFSRCGTLEKVKWPMRRICTVQETEHYKGYRLSLAGLYEELFGETFKDAHRAKNDVEALNKCVIKLFSLGDL